jgi:hypothetical protein
VSLGLTGIDGRVEVRRLRVCQFVAAREQAIELDRHRVVECAQALEIGDDDALECRAVLANGHHLVVLLLVLDEQHAHTGVIQDMVHLLG